MWPKKKICLNILLRIELSPDESDKKDSDEESSKKNFDEDII